MYGKRYVVLDRDGTLIVDEPYLGNPDKVRLLPGVAEGLRIIQGLKLGIVIVTNQSAIGRHFITELTLGKIHERLFSVMKEENIAACPIYYCPHVPDDACPCRKPELGLLYGAAKDLEFNPSDCFVVGDKATDIELGKRVGAVTFRVSSSSRTELQEPEGSRADYIVDGVKAAAVIISTLLKKY